MTEGTLLDAFAASAERHGTRTAIVEGRGTRVSFHDLKARADGLAQQWVAQGLRGGDRILIAMPVGADLYAALAALWSVGAVAVLPEPAMGLRGVRHALATSGVTGLCAGGPYRWLRPLLPGLWNKPLYRVGRADQAGGAGPLPQPRLRDEDIALISFTSGSTGPPKAIPRSHGLLKAQWQAVAPLLASDRDDVDLTAFPLFVLINLVEGRCSVLPNWRMSSPDKVTSAALAAWIETQSVTRLLLPPALCETLAEAPVPARVTTLFTGGGPVFPDIVAALQSQRPDLRIVAVYGSTEAEPIAALDMGDMTPEDRDDVRQGRGLLAGHPVTSIDLRLIEGEIFVAGAHVNTGYLDPARDVETKIRDGTTIWHRTGDAGEVDETGRLWLIGRQGAGVKVQTGTLHPFAIETAARLWPGVRRAALGLHRGAPVLAIEGDARMMVEWQDKARAFGVEAVVHVARIPLDRRHRSKVDHAALATLLKKAHR